MGPNDKLKMAHFKLPHKPIGLEQEICMDTFVIIAFLFITRLKFWESILMWKNLLE